MSTVRHFRHDDAGAPTLTGEVGSLTNVLRKCLVGTAGVAYSGRPAAGWTEEFIGAAANIAAFRNNQADGGCGCYVRVHDNAPGAGGARESRINVYATMSDINTGTNGTALTYFRKSSLLSNAARPWLVIADARTAWVYAWANGDAATYGADNSLHGFGDIESVLPTASAHRYFVLGRQTENDASSGGSISCLTGSDGYSAAMQAADPTGLAAPIQVRPRHYAAGFAYGGATMPADVAGNVLLQKMPPATSAANGFFGWARGLYLPYVQLYTAPGGSLVSGSDRHVVVKGKAAGGSSVSQHFAVALDSVGPW